MRVTIRCGQTEESFDAPDDLLDAVPSPANDARQNRAIADLGGNFIKAYRREIQRARIAAVTKPSARVSPGVLVVPDQLATRAGWADGEPIPGWADSPIIRYQSSTES